MRKTSIAKRKTESAGARESNAGDDFHILWAARRAIQLLNPRSGLRRVFVEKLSAVDETQGDSDEDLFLGVDISEYFGGDTFTSASRVDVSQLKYSTRHPEKNWTSSRLCSASSGASVIHRLAAIYQGFAQNNPRDEVIQKLRIRLISNQPASSELREALIYAQQVLAQRQLKGAALIRELDAQHQQVIQTLSDNVPLNKAEFSDFLRVFDLSGCGENPRQWQRLLLMKELSAHIKDDPVAALLNICESIRREAEPEKRNSAGLTESDILVALGVEYRERLFPAAPHFQPVAKLIETSDVAGLAQTILNAGQGRKIIAHGAAGLGKTTTVQELHRHLPAGSVVLTYDCFGGGNYKVPGGQRHPQRRAFTQLTNEMAVQCGTPILLKPAHEIADLQQDFGRALQRAAKIVAVEQDALLVIVVDAADNAVDAAKNGNDCFVSILWQFPLPENCRLVMTCRTHRRAMLNAPTGIVEYELKGFDKAASAAHLRTIYPEADDLTCSEFHHRTGGNPRMQFYLLRRAFSDAKTLVPLEQLFTGTKETLEELFRDLLESALTHASHLLNTNDLLADLICLTRPVPPKILGEVHNLNFDEALNFCRSLEPGVRLEEGLVWFRDEDFETFLRDQINSQAVKAAHERLGLWFLTAPNATSYAARFVAEHLAQAGRHVELINLAINGPEPVAVKDEITRLQVLRKRLSLAMQAACEMGDGFNAVRLILLAAEAERSNGAVAALVRANPELAMLCGNPNSARRLYLRDSEYDWPGADHLRLAAIFSRFESEEERAKDHLKVGEAWIRRKFSMPKDKTRHWEISLEDIAYGAEAIFWLYSPEDAFNWLNSWRPKDVVLRAATHLIRSLATRIPLAEVEHLIESLGLPALANAVLISTLWRKGHQPSFEYADKTAKRIERFLRRGIKLPDLSHHYSRKNAWAVSFCEAIAAAKIPPDRIISTIRALGPTSIHSAPSHAVDALDDELPLRGACLVAALEGKELTAKHLMPESLRKKDEKNNYDSRNDSERRKFETIIEILLSAFQTRVKTIVGTPPLAEMKERIANDLRRHSFNLEYPVRTRFLFQPWALRACETLLRCDGDATDLLEKIADAAADIIHGASPQFWTAMGKQLIEHEQYQALAYRLFERAAVYVMEHPFPAGDRWEQLLNCADAVSTYDANLCRDYYKRALDAAEGIDDDLIPLLTCYCRISKCLPAENSSQEKQLVAARIARLVETHKDYVPEESRMLWRETLEAVTRLSPADALAMCSRWDDEGFHEVSDGIIPVVKEASRSGFLTPLESLALLRLTGEEHDISADAIPLLETLHRAGAIARPQLSQAMATVSEWIRRDVPLSARQGAAQRIVDWAEKSGLTRIAGLAELHEVLAFVRSLHPSKNETELTSYRHKQEREDRIRELVESAKDGQLKSFAERLHELDELSYGSKPITDFVVSFGKAITPAQRITFLEQLVDAAVAETSLAKNLVESLPALLTDWRNSQTVREWLPSGIQRLLENCLPKLIQYEYETADYLRMVFTLPGLSSPPHTHLFLPAITKHIGKLSPRGLYLIAEALVETLSAKDANDILTWALDKTEQHFSRHSRPLPTLAAPTKIETSSEALARFIWALFGHIDKRVRWRALHAARIIAKQPNEDMLRELMRLSKVETAGMFRSADPKLEFYWMSARSWLMLLLQRLAGEQPGLLYAHVEAITAHVLDKDFPHAQIREIARRTVLRVVETFPEVLPQSLIFLVRQANQPTYCLYPRRSIYEIEDQSDGVLRREDAFGEREFSFDIDTVPYWFAPLSRVFGYPTPKVTLRATRWICDRWWRSNQDLSRDARKWRNEHQWQLMDNRHGSVPKLENLRIYLEYHALHCVAGEMIDEGLPMAVDTYDDPECLWEDWIADGISASNHHWLSDLRTPTPFLPECWGSSNLEEWLKHRLPIDYDAGLGLLEPHRLGEIVIAGQVDLWNSDRSGDVSIASALVHPDYARSLLHALQTTLNPHDFKLSNQIDDQGFLLKNLYYDQRTEDGLDEFDPLFRHTHSSRWVLDEEFTNTMTLRVSKSTQKYFVPSGEIAAWLEIWSDQSARNHERIYEPFSNGQRLWVRIEMLLKYLNKRGLDLIIEVKIARRRDYNSREKEEKYDFGRSIIYLLRRDGSLETISSSRDIIAVFFRMSRPL